jgi:hypothetical protein
VRHGPAGDARGERRALERLERVAGDRDDELLPAGARAPSILMSSFAGVLKVVPFGPKSDRGERVVSRRRDGERISVSFSSAGDGQRRRTARVGYAPPAAALIAFFAAVPFPRSSCRPTSMRP